MVGIKIQGGEKRMRKEGSKGGAGNWAAMKEEN